MAPPAESASVVGGTFACCTDAPTRHPSASSSDEVYITSTECAADSHESRTSLTGRREPRSTVRTASSSPTLSQYVDASPSVARRAPYLEPSAAASAAAPPHCASRTVPSASCAAASAASASDGGAGAAASTTANEVETAPTAATRESESSSSLNTAVDSSTDGAVAASIGAPHEVSARTTTGASAHVWQIGVRSRSQHARRRSASGAARPLAPMSA